MNIVIGVLTESGDIIAIRCITSQIMGADPRFRILLALGRRKGLDKKILTQIETLKNKTFEVSSRRNRTIHDPWLIETRKKTLSQKKSITEKTKHYRNEEIDIKELDRTLDLIAQRHKELGAGRKVVMEWLSARTEARIRQQAASRPQKAP